MSVFTNISALIVTNMLSLIFLSVLLIILTTATRMKCSVGWIALLVASTSFPTYFAVYSLTLEPIPSVFFIVTALTLNLLFVPLLWYFIHYLLNPTFRLSWNVVPHALPALLSCAINIAYYSRLSDDEIAVTIQNLLIPGANLPFLINTILFFLQLLYFPYMLRYIRNHKKTDTESVYTEQEYFDLYWIPKIVMLIFAVLFVVALCYLISPLVASWLNPLLHIVGLSYLTYCVITHAGMNVPEQISVQREQPQPGCAQPQQPPTVPSNRTPVYPTANTATRETSDKETAEEPEDDRMKEICERVIHYLQTTEAYKNNDLILANVAHELGLHQRKISAAINDHLQKNFFELVNGMRVETAKQHMLRLDTSNTLESVYPQCGFNSRSSFYAVFKKIEGITPAKWLESQRKNEIQQ
jgi:AraC-like DNA-binding protein